MAQTHLLRASIPFLLVLASATSLSHPAYAGAGDVVACRSILDDRERLACYDRTVVGLANDMKTNPSDLFGFARPSKVTKEEDFGRGVVTQPPPKPAAPPQPPPYIAPPSGQVAATPVAPPRPPAPAPVPDITSIKVKIILLGDPDGKPIFTLENGQVWRAQSTGSVRLQRNADNYALIEKTFLGGYLLTLNDASYQIKVQRIR